MSLLEKNLKRAIKNHGDKYDYSKAEYVNSKTPITIICPTHGEFQQLINNHVKRGCPKCSVEKRAEVYKIKTRKKESKKFIDKSSKEHGGKYDYSKVEYINSYSKVTIICPTHGEFEQLPQHHTAGSGCPQCAREACNNDKRLTTEEFMTRVRPKHGDKYDYSKMQYKGYASKIIVICKDHGEFEQSASDHLKGKGCPYCHGITLTEEQFVNRSMELHNGKYDYSKVEYTINSNPVTIICPEHGEFEQRPYSHLAGSGCPKCVVTTSNGHQELLNYIKHVYDGDIINNDREQINPYELDVYIPAFKLAIEFNGDYYHSFAYLESPKEKLKHQQKHVMCVDNGIRLIQVAENEWLNRRHIVESIINHSLGMSTGLYARNLELVQISNKEHIRFINNNHLYGHGSNVSIAYGLKDNNELISVMSFNRRKDHWEINRFATKTGYNVAGGASRLFKGFIVENKPDKVITFADAKLSCGKVYEKLGFTFEYLTRPNYKYYKKGITYSRQQFQKHKLKNKLDVFDPELSEPMNMFNNGYRRIWDAGHYKYIKEF